MLKRLLFAVLLLCACAAQAAVYSLPWGPKPQFVDANGAPMSSGTITFYAAGSSTLQNTYTSQVGNVANSNPITLNVRGESPNEVWLTGGLTYKIILKDSSGSTVWTVDNVSGVNDPTAAVQDEWKASGLVPTYVSATSFTFPGDQTVTFTAGRRIKTTNSGGTIYSSIATSTFAVNTTTITVVNDSGTLDSGLSAVSYGLIAYANTSLPAFRGASTGAVSRLLLDKERDFVNAKDYGAKCDNATDDTTAIQNAFSASARSINFPDGTCLYSTPLTVTTAKRIVGTPNTILRWTGNTASGTIQVGFQGTNLERVELRQLQIEKTVAATATTLLHVRGVQHSVFDSLTFGSTTIGAGTGATTDNILTEKRGSTRGTTSAANSPAATACISRRRRPTTSTRRTTTSSRTTTPRATRQPGSRFRTASTTSSMAGRSRTFSRLGNTAYFSSGELGARSFATATSNRRLRRPMTFG
jgi:hypothetical protein